MKKKIQKLKNLFNDINILIVSIPIAFIISLFYCLFMHSQEIKIYRNSQNKMKQIPVIFPNRQPDGQQKGIDIAMALFSIESSENVAYPVYRENLPFRGLTSGNPFLNEKEVFIGEMAYSSWGILGSTLAHEIEIHGNQSFLKIEFLNYTYNLFYYTQNLIKSIFPVIQFEDYKDLGFGAYQAEKEAYIFEINCEKRFNLNTKEIIAIKNILDNELI
ncbi:hypothetical protein [Silvanigrella aquatica]|uniref:Uncharacterized protein n=1 Tax=Silvanigrella aquatica TaxID=1915309 RepID=A0A1L4CY92_9BACT|nr:hypothetical protein [Silvanigrella aquatica]APJ02907.1 hypothetical protein AXG55_02815 [Silvanigrella aquatica]